MIESKLTLFKMQVKKSPVKLVDWHSLEGLARLSNFTHKADFSRLSSQFQNQIYRTTCGPTTGAIVLNALRIGKSNALPKTSFLILHKNKDICFKNLSTGRI